MAVQRVVERPQTAGHGSARGDTREPGGERSPRTWEERRLLVGALDDSVAWPSAAGSLLADLGFRLVQAPAGGGANHLLVALRDRPTLRHFDPEGISFYASAGEHAAPVCLSRATLGSQLGGASRRVLWGHVHVEDRLPVENRFLTFGGELRIAAPRPDLTLLDLRSPAPIVRWGGHSQGTDPVTDAIGAFFARLMVPIDFVPGMEARISAASPEVLFRAFLLDTALRLARADRSGMEPSPLERWVAGAWRVAREDPDACLAAEALLAELRTGSPLA